MAIIKNENQRVGIFIDAQNLYHSAKNLYRKKVNFPAVVKEALADRKLIRSVAYVITSEAGDEKSFFEALEKAGIETKTKDLQVFSGGAKKGDWDVGLAVDAMSMSEKLDVVIIISGDGDFIPLVEYLKMQGCQVEAASFRRSASGRLVEAVDDFLDLGEDLHKYMMGGNTRRTSYKPSYSNSRSSNSNSNNNTKNSRAIFSKDPEPSDSSPLPTDGPVEQSKKRPVIKRPSKAPTKPRASSKKLTGKIRKTPTTATKKKVSKK